VGIIDQFLSRFGLRIENHRPPPPGVKQVRSLRTVASIFDAEATRQRSESVFFIDRQGPPKFYTGPGGIKLPFFHVPGHLE
jgi:hypothetical protein